MKNNFKCNAGIYMIICTANNKFYIGASTSIKDRITQHWSKLRGGVHDSIEMQEDFFKYREESFIAKELCILHEPNDAIIKVLEYLYIQEYEPQYNTITFSEYSEKNELWKNKISKTLKNLYKKGYVNPRLKCGKKLNIFNAKGEVINSNVTVKEAALFVEAKDYHYINTQLKKYNGVYIAFNGKYIIIEEDKSLHDLFLFYKNIKITNKHYLCDSNGEFKAISKFSLKEQKLIRERNIDNSTFIEIRNIKYYYPGMINYAV